MVRNFGVNVASVCVNLSDSGMRILSLCVVFVARYCLHAKRIFAELHEHPFVVDLDLRGMK